MALDKLPLELLRLVANYLTTPEYGKLRLTCTAIEKLCFDDWAKEFFTTRQFAMTRFSLQNLLDISNDVALRPYLQRIIISNECVDCRLHAHHHSHLPDDPIGVLQYEKLMSHRRNEQYFETTGTDCKMLTEALSNLKRFQSLELRDYYSRFNGGRTRDNTTWKSYGATTFENETGRDLQSHHHAMSSIFTKVIAAAQAAKVQIAKLVASPRHSPNFLKLESSAFHVPPDAHTSYAMFLGSIESMTLHLQLRNRDLFPRARDEAWTDASRAEELQDSSDVASLINFLQLAQPCLQSLRLNFGNHRVWSLFSKIGPPAVSLSQLRCLELGVLFIEEQDLIDFLGKFDTIKEMTFFRVVLLDGSWASFLSNIPATLQSLRLNLVKQTGSPQEPGYNPNGKRVAFKKSPDVVPTHFTDGCIVPDYTIADSFDIKSKLDAAISVIIADDDDIFRLAHGGSNGSAASDSDADMDSDEEEDEDMGDEEESEEHEDE